MGSKHFAAAAALTLAVGTLTAAMVEDPPYG